jgi:hypothetical protein
MALSTYDELRASVASWLNRTDLTDQIPDFIAIAEARMQSDLRLREGIEATTLATSVDEQTVLLPEDWLEFKHISYAGKPLEYISADRLRKLAGNE